MYQKIGILAVLASVLLSGTVLATPSLKVANAQENQTGEMNQTQAQVQGLPVDQWIIILKEENPTLGDTEQIGDTEQSPAVKDAIEKIKAMQDPQQAVDTFNALQALHSC
jgi:hypothetical protein